MTQTALSDADAKAIGSGFGLDKVTGFSRLDVGTINSNYRLETPAGAYFLRINEGKSDSDVSYEFELVREIANAGVLTPVPVASTDGAPFVRFGDKQASLFPWIDGEHRDKLALWPIDVSQLGRALARLHTATEGLIERFGRRGIYTIDQIAERCAAIDAGDDRELADAVEIAKAELDSLLAISDQRAALPQAIIHGDLFLDNVLYTDDGCALLDFEQASIGAPLYDLAVCLGEWCVFDGKMATDFAADMIRGYTAERPLPELDADSLLIEARAAAVRFTVTRITDVHLPGLTREGKDYRDYLDRVRLWSEKSLDVIWAYMEA